MRTAYLALGIFTVILQRRYRFYLLSTVIPLAAFSLLSPLALLVPADSGEKITLSVTILLANLVFMGSLSDSIPRVADSVSVFGEGILLPWMDEWVFGYNGLPGGATVYSAIMDDIGGGGGENNYG